MRFTALLLSIALSVAAPVYAKDYYSIDVTITGLKDSVDASAILKISSDNDESPMVTTFTNSERDKNGHFRKKIQTDFLKNEASIIYLIGELRSPSDKIIGQIPLRLIKATEFSPRLVAKSSIGSVRNDKRAFRESYPFSESFGRGFINSNNLESVLRATKILIKNQFVKGDSWPELFNSYFQNLSYFKRDNSKISTMLSFLKNYGDLRNSPEFYSFYTRMLVRLDELDVDGTQIYPDQVLKKYIYEEYHNLITSQTAHALPHFGQIIRLMRDEGRYGECINLAEGMLTSIRSTILPEKIVGDGNIRNFVLSTMQGVTECLQLDFAKRGRNGNRLDRNAAAKFHLQYSSSADNIGAKVITAYVDLFDSIEEQGNVFPRNPSRKYDSASSSRIVEISGYYEAFVKPYRIEGVAHSG